MKRSRSFFRSVLSSFAARGAATIGRPAAALVALFAVSLAVPPLALADFSGGGGVNPLATSEAGTNILGYVDAIVTFVTGPFGIALCTIGLLIAVGGMIYRSQRGQPFGRFGLAAVGVVLFFITPQLVTWLGQASGAAF